MPRKKRAPQATTSTAWSPPPSKWSLPANAVLVKYDEEQSARLAHAAMLASALSLDMTGWFTPNAANYFTRISKAQILDALREKRNAPPAPAWEKPAKADLAALAEREISGTPGCLRCCARLRSIFFANAAAAGAVWRWRPASSFCAPQGTDCPFLILAASDGGTFDDAECRESFSGRVSAVVTSSPSRRVYKPRWHRLIPCHTRSLLA